MAIDLPMVLQRACALCNVLISQTLVVVCDGQHWQKFKKIFILFLARARFIVLTAHWEPRKAALFTACFSK
jgi:hypothetical protein